MKIVKHYLHMKCKLCAGKMYFNQNTGKVEIIGGKTDCKAHPKTLNLFKQEKK